jgi:hypothetical protein
MKWVGMWHIWETGEVHAGFWWGDLRSKSPLGRPMHRWEHNITINLLEVDGEA